MAWKGEWVAFLEGDELLMTGAKKNVLWNPSRRICFRWRWQDTDMLKMNSFTNLKAKPEFGTQCQRFTKCQGADSQM